MLGWRQPALSALVRRAARLVDRQLVVAGEQPAPVVGVAQLVEALPRPIRPRARPLASAGRECHRPGRATRPQRAAWPPSSKHQQPTALQTARDNANLASFPFTVTAVAVEAEHRGRQSARQHEFAEADKSTTRPSRGVLSRPARAVVKTPPPRSKRACQALCQGVEFRANALSSLDKAIRVSGAQTDTRSRVTDVSLP